jgi:hypothetical protein
VRGRDLAIAWVGLAGLFLALLVFSLNSWRSLSARGGEAAAEFRRLTAEINARQQEIVREMRANAALLQEMIWTSAGADPAAFIRRVAELAEDTGIKVLAIGPLERQATPQFNKSWHTLELRGPYHDLRLLAARVEAEHGILENVTLSEVPRGPEAAEPRLGRPPDSGSEVQARFRMASVELTREARAILEKASAASGIPVAPPAQPSAPALPVPAPPAGAPPMRDPFVYAVPVAPRPVPPLATRVADRVDLQGIVGFPGGHLAIVDNQIVKIGDRVKGYRVEEITERGLLLRAADGTLRRLTLPDIVAPAGRAPAAEPPTPPPAPRR